MNCNQTTKQPSIGRQKTIVIADDDADIVGLLTKRCHELGYTAIGASSAIDALNAISQCKPDVVCLDVNMSSGSGLRVCEMMAGNDQLQKIPTIVLTAQSDETTIRRCHDMMAFYVQKNADIWSRVGPLVREILGTDSDLQAVPASPVTKEGTPKMNAISTKAPLEKEDLMDAVFEILGDQPDLIRVAGDDEPLQADSPAEDANDTPWVLCIDDDADFSEALGCRLENHGVAVVRAFDGTEGYRMAFTHQAGAILLDYNMPNGQGDYVLGRLKENPVTRDIPVFVVTGNKNRLLERKMLSLGAAGFFSKPVRFELIREALSDHINILAHPVEC